MAIQQRWRATWVAELGHDSSGDADPHRNKEDNKDFPTTFDFDADDNIGETDPVMLHAAKWACEHNCYGSEGYVTLQERGYDRAVYEDTGRRVYAWYDVERYLCGDGAVVERVD